MRPKGTPKTGGRKAGTPNKSTADVKALAEPYGPEAIETLAAVMRDTTQPAAARIAAADKLLDRGYGKPKQPIDHQSSDGSMSPLTLADFYAENGTQP